MTIDIKVTVNAREERVEEEGDILHVYVQARPVDGSANESVINLLSEYYGVPRGSIRIKRGHRSRYKLIEVLYSASP